MKFKRVAVGVIFAVALAGLAGCGPTNITNYGLQSVPVGTLTNANVTIEAVDGSFALRGGQQFSSPFQTNIWNPVQPAFNDAAIVEGFSTARQLGGKDVLVRVQGRAQPLHGVLLLSQVYGAVTGPAARSYQITIPDDKIAAAYAGNTTVAFENGNYVEQYDDGQRFNRYWRTWILWMSATPL